MENKETFISKIMDNPKTLLAIMWSVFSMVTIWIIEIRYGEKEEITTLVIGFLTGTVAGSIIGTYFSSDNKKHQPDDAAKQDTLTIQKTEQ